MEGTYLQFNMVNWITVFGMVLGGYFILALAAQVIQNAKARNGNA